VSNYLLSKQTTMPKPLLLLLGVALPFVLIGQKTTISGYITDGSSGEPLISANVFESRLGAGAVSNVYGFYSLTLESRDSAVLLFSYIGYQQQEVRAALSANTTLNIALQPFAELATVEVRADRSERIEQRTQMWR